MGIGNLRPFDGIWKDLMGEEHLNQNGVNEGSCYVKMESYLISAFGSSVRLVL